MKNAPYLAALLPFLCFAAAGSPAMAHSMTLDAGLRASIYDDNYNLGTGGELGLLVPASPAWDFGLHLNASHYASKLPETIGSTNEYGGYVTAYYKPSIDQFFSMRMGPHLGYAKIENDFIDVGGDIMAVLKTTEALDIYVAFIPSFMIGKAGQTLVRIGIGLEYNLGK